MNSKNCFLFVIGTIAVLSLLIIVFSSCVQKTTSGKLKVTSNIESVNVIFNNETYITPFEIENIKAGEYRLSAYKEGYQVKTIPVAIKARETTEINIELEEDPANNQIIEGAPIDYNE